MDKGNQNPAKDLQTDENGNVILYPVTGWIAGPVMDISVLLALQYAENQAQLESGGKQIQFVMTAPQARELSLLLEKWANQILSSGSSRAN